MSAVRQGGKRDRPRANGSTTGRKKMKRPTIERISRKRRITTTVARTE